MHFKLRHHRCIFWVLTLFCFALNWQILGQFFFGNHYRSSMDTNVALETFEPASNVHNFFDFAIEFVQSP